MKIQYVDSAVGTSSAYQFLSSFIIDDWVTIDAGALGLLTPQERQKRIQHVFLSHSHMDHIATLPLFLDNVYDPAGESVCVHASDAVQDCLRRDVFNDRLWPDLTHMSDKVSPFVQFESLEDGQAVTVGDLKITPLSVDHVVPCFAFLIESGTAAVAIVTDTGPTQQVWERLQCQENLQALFLEASFPNSFQWLAEKSKHLTPQQFAGEIAKLERSLPVYAIHLKPNFYDEVIDELTSLGLEQLEIAQPDHVYEW